MARDSKVTMPMTSAGIVGMSSDMSSGGIEIDPKVMIVVVFVFVAVILAVGMFIG